MALDDGSQLNRWLPHAPTALRQLPWPGDEASPGDQARGPAAQHPDTPAPAAARSRYSNPGKPSKSWSPLPAPCGWTPSGAELESLASAALQRAWPAARNSIGPIACRSRPRCCQPLRGPAGARNGWPNCTSWPRAESESRFAAQIVLGIGRLAVTLYQPGALLRQAFSGFLAAAVAASGLVVGGWKTAAAMAAAVVSVLSTAMWVLRSDDRTRRLAQLICALRDAPRKDPDLRSETSSPGTGTEPLKHARPIGSTTVNPDSSYQAEPPG